MDGLTRRTVSTFLGYRTNRWSCFLTNTTIIEATKVKVATCVVKTTKIKTTTTKIKTTTTRITKAETAIT